MQGELRLSEQRMKDTSKKLTEINVRLTVIMEDKARLSKFLEEATSVAEANRLRRDRDEADLKAMLNQLEVEVVGLESEKRRMEDLLQVNIEQFKLASIEEERSVTERIVELRAENALLLAKMDMRDQEESTLRTRVFQLREEMSGSQENGTSWNDEGVDVNNCGTHRCRLERGDDDDKDD